MQPSEHEYTMSSSANALPPYLTVRQAAAELQVRPQTLYAYIHSGLLRAGRLPSGSDIRIRRVDFDAFVDGLFDGAVPANDLEQAEPAPTPAPQPVRGRTGNVFEMARQQRRRS